MQAIAMRRSIINLNDMIVIFKTNIISVLLLGYPAKYDTKRSKTSSTNWYEIYEHERIH